MRNLFLILIMVVCAGLAYAQFTSFDATNPTVIAPKPAKVYDKFWLKKFVVEAPSPTQRAGMTAEFVPYDGAGEVDPNGSSVYVTSDDLFGMAAQNNAIATAMEMTFRALKDLGISQGVMANTTVVPDNDPTIH